MEKISVVIITFNEAKNIGDCLRSVQDFADEVVVMDSHSSDDTVAIARQFQAKIYYQQFLGHVQQKNLAMSKASLLWVLSLDADERVSPALAQKIIQLKKDGMGFDGYSVNRLNYYLDGWFRFGGWYPDRKLRLVKKDLAYWAGQNPHDCLKMQEGSRIQALNLDLLHYTYHNLAEHLSQMQKFSEISAEQKSANKTKFIMLRLLVNPMIKFIKAYIIKGAFLAGQKGFVFSVMASFSVFIKYAKLWELERKNKNHKESNNG